MGQFLEKAYDELSEIKENCEKEREKYCGYTLSNRFISHI